MILDFMLLFTGIDFKNQCVQLCCFYSADFGNARLFLLWSTLKRYMMLMMMVICWHADEIRPEQVEVMLKDAYLMKGVSHENVSCVVMTCLDHPPLLIYSDVTGTGFNLKKFLQHCKMSEVDRLH